MKIKLEFEPKNQQQKNKICGTIFEKYTIYLLRKIYGNEVIRQLNVRNFIDKKMLKMYMFYFKSYYKIVYNPISYLYKVMNGEDGFLSETLKYRKYKQLKIVRLDKIVKLADAIMFTKKDVYVIDSKFRENFEGKITTGDYLRLMCYKEIIEKSEKREIKPIFVISSNSFSLSKEIRPYLGKRFEVKPVKELEKFCFTEEPTIKVYLNRYFEYIAEINGFNLHIGKISL